MAQVTKQQIAELQHRLSIDQVTGEMDDFTISAVKNFILRVKGDYSIEKIKKGDWHEWSNVLNDIRTRTPHKSLDFDTVMTNLNKKSSKEDTDLQDDHDYTTDLFETTFALPIEKNIMNPDEYVSDNTPRQKYIYIHHTSGWGNPYNTIHGWETDTRGRVGTHFVIGGINVRSGNTVNDGKILQAIPLDSWGHHLGNPNRYGFSHDMQKECISIEICNFGYLQKQGSRYYTYTGQEVSKENVTEVSWRGYRYWQTYTEKQMRSLKVLITHIANIYSINLQSGLKQRILNNSSNPERAFDVDQGIKAGSVPGLLSHSNVRHDKTDVSPQQGIIDMILSL